MDRPLAPLPPDSHRRPPRGGGGGGQAIFQIANFQMGAVEEGRTISSGHPLLPPPPPPSPLLIRIIDVEMHSGDCTAPPPLCKLTDSRWQKEKKKTYHRRPQPSLLSCSKTPHSLTVLSPKKNPIGWLLSRPIDFQSVGHSQCVVVANPATSMSHKS